jgi:hypothetical protein
MFKTAPSPHRDVIDIIMRMNEVNLFSDKNCGKGICDITKVQ